MHDRTVIGTTDTETPEANVAVTDADREFLLNQANRCLNLATPLTNRDIIAERCGVRPLVIKDASTLDKIDWISLSRKHVVELNQEINTISIFGGKLTDCLNVGQEVVQLVKKIGIQTTKPKKWFGEESIEVPVQLKNLIAGFHENEAEEISIQLWRRHGKDAFEIVQRWFDQPQLSDLVFSGLFFTRGELEYIFENEHVCLQEDLLRRRTPIALLRTLAEIENANLKLGIRE